MTQMVDIMGGHRKYLEPVAKKIVETLIRKDAEYGASWKLRGGTGAYMMMARKWDRLENGLKPAEKEQVPTPTISRLGAALSKDIPPYDIFMAGILDNRPEGIIDDIRDLTGYLLLVLAELEFQKTEVLKPDAAASTIST